MTLSKNSNAFLALVRLGIGHVYSGSSDDIDWPAIKDLAVKHGLSAIVLDGIERLPEKKQPPKVELLTWIGEILQEYEQRYELYCRAIADLSGWHNSHGYKMMVLKGLACSMDWPKPNRRPCGDIDIWQYGLQKEIDALMVKEKRIRIDTTHHHHTVYYWNAFMVENHYDFLNVHHHKSNVELESILKELGHDDSHYVELYGEKVYLPSANLHALFLLRHSMSNFASTELKLRQLLDWGFFVKEHGKEVNWKWLEVILERFGMKRLFQVFNAICVEDLGFEVSIFNQVQFELVLKDRVINDILSPEFSEKTPQNIFLRVPFKYRRWKANAWKHELCFNESMKSAFWSGIKSHLLKPSSI